MMTFLLKLSFYYDQMTDADRSLGIGHSKIWQNTGTQRQVIGCVLWGQGSYIVLLLQKL